MSDVSARPIQNHQRRSKMRKRTVGLVHLHAAEWRIDAGKIGVLGFSAGGHLVTALSTHSMLRLCPPVDAAHKESCRPDFAVALYPGHLWIDEEKFELNPDIHVTDRTPPTFLVQTEDNPVDDVDQSLVYYIALENAGVPWRCICDATAHRASDYGMASIDGDVAGYDRNHSEAIRI
jgi:acetyl esterase/lipase